MGIGREDPIRWRPTIQCSAVQKSLQANFATHSPMTTYLSSPSYGVLIEPYCGFTARPGQQVTSSIWAVLKKRAGEPLCVLVLDSPMIEPPGRMITCIYHLSELSLIIRVRRARLLKVDYKILWLMPIHTTDQTS